MSCLSSRSRRRTRCSPPGRRLHRALEPPQQRRRPRLLLSRRRLPCSSRLQRRACHDRLPSLPRLWGSSSSIGSRRPKHLDWRRSSRWCSDLRLSPHPKSPTKLRRPHNRKFRSPESPRVSHASTQCISRAIDSEADLTLFLSPRLTSISPFWRTSQGRPRGGSRPRSPPARAIRAHEGKRLPAVNDMDSCARAVLTLPLYPSLLLQLHAAPGQAMLVAVDVVDRRRANRERSIRRSVFSCSCRSSLAPC